MNDIIATSKTRVEIDQDFCANRYGDGAGGGSGLCTAALGTTGERKCFNTRPTCQDPDNFARTGLALSTSSKLNNDSATVALTAPWTLEFMAQRENLANVSSEFLFSYPMATAGATGAPADGFEVRVTSFNGATGLGGLALMRYDSGSLTWQETTGDVVPLDEPFHVELTTNGTDLFLYVTGEEGRRKLRITRTGGAENLAAGFVHLNRTAEAEAYAYSELRFWSRQLTAKERRRYTLRSLKIVNEAADHDGLEHYWRIDSVDEDATADLVGGGGDIAGTFTYAQGLAYRPITLRHTKKTQDVVAEHLPSLMSVDTAPSRLQPGQGLGQRASGSATFSDHPYGDFFIDKYRDERISGAAQNDGVGYNPAERGSYWGKWRARNFESFFNRELRVLQIVGATEIERNYVMESVDGPSRGNTFTINFLDPLIQLDGDRAQAPRPNTGQIANVGGITAGDTSLTLKPSGIGDEEYSASGWISVGREVMAFTRSGDTVTLGTRGALNTEAQSHDEDDTVQEVLHLQGTADSIQRTLSVDFAGVNPEFVDDDQWSQEAADNIGLNFEHFVTKPTPVSELSKALMKQAAYNIFWDEVEQTIPFEALKNAEDLPLLVDESWIDGDSLEIREQQDKRVSQVWVHYGLIDPTQRIEDGNNYAALHQGINLDTQSLAKWGKPKIETIHGRFIQRFNLTAAQQAEEKIISRFARPPRSASFNIPLWRDGQLSLAQLIRLGHRRLQRDDGLRELANWQVQGLERREQHITVHAEEFSLFAEIGSTKEITISSPAFDLNLRDEWEAVWGEPQSGDVVVINVQADVGSEVIGGFSIRSGDWPDGVVPTVNIDSSVEVQGPGGAGGEGAPETRHSDPLPEVARGQFGGIALLADAPITLNSTGKQTAGAGGGGGGAMGENDPSRFVVDSAGGGGGGAAGYLAGQGGAAGEESLNEDDPAQPGDAGTRTAGGTGGDGAHIQPLSGFTNQGGTGGTGGNPAQDGANGQRFSNPYFSGPGGVAGFAMAGPITKTAGGTITGREAQSLIQQDHFNDTNGTALTSHQSELGQGWTSTSGGLEIQSNRVVNVTGFNFHFNTQPAVDDDVRMEAVWGGGNSVGVWFTFRHDQSDNSYYFIEWGAAGTFWRFGFFDGSTITSILEVNETTTYQVRELVRIEMEMVGTSFKFWEQGNLLMDTTDSTRAGGAGKRDVAFAIRDDAELLVYRAYTL